MYQYKAKTEKEALTNFDRHKKHYEYLCVIKSQSLGETVYYVESAPPLIRSFERLIKEYDKQPT